MTDFDYDVAIVGGGVAGLAAAYELRDRRIILLEASGATSGRVQSVQEGPFWANVGAQFLAGPGPLNEYYKDFGVPILPIENSQPGVAIGRKLVPSSSPVSFVLRLPISPFGRIEMARVGMKMVRAWNRLTNAADPEGAARYRAKMDSITAAEFLGVKNKIVDEILRSSIRIFAGAEPEEISAERGIIFVGLATKLTGKVAPVFLPQGGNDMVSKGITKTLGDRVRLNAPVSSVSPEEGGVRITYGNGEVATAKQCIMAIPSAACLRVVNDLEAPERDAMTAVKFGSILAAAFFTDETSPMPWHGFYNISITNRSFQAVTNHGIVVRKQNPGIRGGALTLSAGGDAARRLMERSDPEIQQILEDDFYDLFPKAKGQVKRVVIQRWPEALPIWGPGGRAKLSAVRRRLDRIHLAGDWLDFPSMQNAANSGVSAAKAATEGLG